MSITANFNVEGDHTSVPATSVAMYRVVWCEAGSREGNSWVAFLDKDDREVALFMPASVCQAIAKAWEETTEVIENPS